MINLLLISISIYAVKSDDSDAKCASDLGINYALYPGCEKLNTCFVTQTDVIDRSFHDFKCIIFKSPILSHQIPDGLFLAEKSNITHLYAESVQISELKRSSFLNAPGLQSISLRGNNIQQIKETVFYGARNVRILDLRENEIAEFSSDAFERLDKLEILDLSSNSITEIPFNLFEPLTNLVFLNLRHNHLTIRYGIFPEFVKSIDLSYNIIDIHRKFKIFALLSNLETLLLHGNKIAQIDPSIYESNLKYLGLSDNRFTCHGLADVLLEMKRNNIITVFENPKKNVSNIQGIDCLE